MDDTEKAQALWILGEIKRLIEASNLVMYDKDLLQGQLHGIVDKCASKYPKNRFVPELAFAITEYLESLVAQVPGLSELELKSKLLTIETLLP